MNGAHIRCQRPKLKSALRNTHYSGQLTNKETSVIFYDQSHGAPYPTSFARTRCDAFPLVWAQMGRQTNEDQGYLVPRRLTFVSIFGLLS